MLVGLMMALRLFSSETPSQAINGGGAQSSDPLKVSRNGELFGHLPYQEVSKDKLYPLKDYPKVLMRASAANALEQMIADARLDGVEMVPLSGFRSKTDQDYLFFEVKKQRNQTAQERSRVSAPVGYSEHHTGYAIDIGDSSQPETHLEETFEKSPTFQWLEANAARYSFELSFPKDNAQGVSYEPWHWRFVGDQDSLETFYQGRNLSQPSPTEK